MRKFIQKAFRYCPYCKAFCRYEDAEFCDSCGQFFEHPFIRAPLRADGEQ